MVKMEQNLIITIIVAALGSSGLWAFISFMAQILVKKYEEKHGAKTAADRMLLGLGHDRIIYLCSKYMDRGYITADEYEDLNKYLYKPYRDLGGNGTAEKLMLEVEKLPIKPS